MKIRRKARYDVVPHEHLTVGAVYAVKGEETLFLYTRHAGVDYMVSLDDGTIYDIESDDVYLAVEAEVREL